MKILALDLGTKTGWAASIYGAVASGVQDFSPRRFDGGGIRFLRFREWLREILDDGAYDLVCFEEVRRHLGTDAAHVYGGLLAHLSEMCETRKIPYEGVSVGAIKKSACGRGNAKKPEMIAAAARLFPFERIVDDNHADALCLLHMRLAQRRERRPLDK